MKRLNALAGAFLFSAALAAQVPEFEWAVGLNINPAVTNLPNQPSSEFRAATDPLGNVYTIGFYADLIDFDPGAGTVYLDQAGGSFVKKMDPYGNLVWVKRIGTWATQNLIGLHVDASRVYITGQFYGTVDFNPDIAVTNNLVSNGNADIFVLTLDNSTGNYFNAFSMGGSGQDYGSSISIRSGSLFVAGTFNGSFDANLSQSQTTMITSNGLSDVFVMRISVSGNLSWIRTFGSTGNEGASGGFFGPAPPCLDVDEITGDVYTAGFYSGTMNIDPTGGNTPAGFSGSTDIFVQRLTAAGAFVWGKGIGGPSGEMVKDLRLDQSGNPHIVGYFHNTVDFDPDPVGAAPRTAPGTTQHAFVLKLTTTGLFSWVANVGSLLAGGGDTDGNALTIGSNNEVYYTGKFTANIDIDPDPVNTLNLSSSNAEDGFISGLSSTGTFLWAKQIGNNTITDGIIPSGICTDAANAIYTCGQFEGAMDFNTESGTYMLPVSPLLSSNFHDGFLHKMKNPCTSNPGYEWAGDIGNTGLVAGNTGNAYGRSIKTDAAGNVYSTGYFTGTVDLDPSAAFLNFTALPGEDIYVQKLDASGNLVWAKQLAGRGNERGLSLDLDNAGNVIIGGYFDFEIDVNPDPAIINLRTTAGDKDILLVKLDANGALVWAKTMGSTGLDFCNAVTFDASGNVIHTGSFTGTVNFNPSGANNFTALGQNDMYVQRFTAAGNYNLFRQQAGTTGEEGKSVTVAPNGDILVCGNFSGTTNFNYSSNPAQNLTAAVGYNGFVLRLNFNGVFQWVKHIDGVGIENAAAIASDNYSNAIVTGFFSGTTLFNGTSLTSSGANDAFIMKLNPAGNTIWVKAFGGAGTVYSNAVHVNSCDDLYLTGHFQGTCNFDPAMAAPTITSVGGTSDVFILKLAENGTFEWVKRMGNGSTDIGNGIYTDASANVYTTGSFQATVDFNPGTNSAVLTATGTGTDAFVQKLNINIPFFMPVYFAEEESDQPADTPQAAIIFPNPATDKLTVSFAIPATGTINLFDITGQLMQQIPLNATIQQEIQLDKQAAGMYLIQISAGDWSQSYRVVKQ